MRLKTKRIKVFGKTSTNKKIKFLYPKSVIQVMILDHVSAELFVTMKFRDEIIVTYLFYLLICVGRGYIILALHI